MKFEVDNEIKLEYLNTKPIQTAKVDFYVLRTMDEYEDMVGKPVYNMSYQELRQMIAMQFRNTSRGVVCKNVSIIKNYIDYCIKKNIVMHGENRLSTFMSKDAPEFMDRKTLLGRFIDRDTLREYQKICYNEQDKLFLELLYVGVEGIKLREITSLTIDALDEENKMLTVDMGEGKFRRISVEVFTMELIKDTYNQERYVENNGEITDNIRLSAPRESVINKVGKYVFRVPGKKKFEAITNTLLGSRMRRIKKWVGNPYLTTKALRDSGMIQLAMDAYKEKGEVTKEDYQDICDRFNYGTESPDGYWALLRDTFEQYKELLGI